MRIKGYYFITDSSLSRRGNVSDAEKALLGGASTIQYREKTLNTREMYDEAVKLRALTAGSKALFLVNDRVDIALAADADGVHLGQNDMPICAARKLLGEGKVIGLTVHNLEEAEEAEEMGADYIAIAPIFATETKKDAGKPCGVGMIKKIKEKVKPDLVAIGGITLSNASEVIRAGADSLCAISEVVSSEDVKGQTEKIQELFVKYQKTV